MLNQATEYFDLPADIESPYMLFVASVGESQRIAPGADAPVLHGLDKLKSIRSRIPATTHVDGSARVQTVDEHRHPRFHNLLKAFASQTQCPLVVNTSFNVRGEPIVCTAEDAYRCFMNTNIDILVIEDFILHKRDQPPQTTPSAPALQPD